MTQEEAIEIIRKNMPSDKSLPVYEALQTLVPELAESEDERMVVKIARTLSFAAAHNLITDYDELLAMQNWLEKQKELFESGRGLYYYDGEKTIYCGDPATAENPFNFAISQHKRQKECLADNSKTSASEDERIIKWIKKEIEDKYVVEGIVNNKLADEAFGWLEKQKDLDKMIVVSPEVWDNAISDAYENGKKDGEKQKEQKPDSLIYDKDLDKAAREFYLSGGAASPVDSTGLVPIVRMAEFGATWMKERMEKEQKPCWNPSEEDVALFNKAITTNASLSPQERAKLDILRMKFKHRPVIEQKEQKPAEQVEINKSLSDAVIAELGKYNGENYWKSPWAIDSTGLQYPLHFAKLGAKWQKEQKPSDLPAGFYVTLPDGEKYYAKEMRCNGMNVKVVEPKPAEWSKEDEEMLNSCISSIEEAKENRYAYKETDGDTSYDHEIAWLKSLPERFNLQSKQEQNDYITPHKEFFKFIYDRLINVHKENPNVDYMRSFKERLNNLSFGEKQEWSEEDEKMLRTIISDGSRGVELDSKQISWLKSLRPQSKKELSIEKAIQWLDDTFYFLNNSSGRGRDCEITTHDFDSLEEMYDSFRKAVTVDSEPSWRPSEEQMESLAYAIQVLNSNPHPKSAKAYQDLQTLYKNIKYGN